MVYYLGKNVSINCETESETYGISPSGTAVTSGNPRFILPLGSADGELFEFDTYANPFQGVVGIDINLENNDEDISYFGANTRVTTQINSSIKVSITRKRGGNHPGGTYESFGGKFWDVLYNDCRWGIDTNISDNLADGISNIKRVDFGYRLQLGLFYLGAGSETKEIMTVRNAQITEHSAVTQANEVQEETIIFMSEVTPVLSESGNFTVTLLEDL